MNEQIAKVITKIKETGGKFSKKQKMALGSLLAAILLFSAGAAIILNNQPYETLFTGLSQEEASEIMGKLQESGVNYKYTTEGTLAVPKEQVEQLKAQLVYEGYPKSGFTYDIFKSNIDLMTTDFEKNSYKVYDLQNRIGATISLFEGVKEAKVTLALGEDKKYVLDDSSTEATASVVVIMKDSGSPSQEQVKGIQRLVSRSVPGLIFENVTVVDGNGREMSVDSSMAGGASQLKLDLEKQVDDNLRAKIVNVLSPLFGTENIRVEVKSTIDVDKKIQENINYTPNADNRGIPSRITQEQEISKTGDGAGGIPGTESNTDIPNYTVVEQDGTENFIRTQNDTQFNVNSQKQQVQSDAGVLTDLNVSVALNGVNLNARQTAEIRALIARTAGINQELENDKIAIVNMPFYNPVPEPIGGEGEENPNALPNWMMFAIAGAAGFIVLLLIIILLVRKKKKKKQQTTVQQKIVYVPAKEDAGNAAPQPGVDPNAGMDLLNIKNERGMELREEIRGFADQNPEIAAQLIKQWLRGGEHNG